MTTIQETFPEIEAAAQALEKRIDAKIRADHMGNTVDVNENEYTLTSLEERREAVLKLEQLIDDEEDDPETPSD